MKETSEDALTQLDQHLTVATTSLNEAGRILKRTELHYSTNIRRIVEAMASILAVQLEIYELRPDLTPEHLTPGWASSAPHDAPWKREDDT